MLKMRPVFLLVSAALAASMLNQASAQTYQACDDANPAVNPAVNFECPDDTTLVTEYPPGSPANQYATCGALGSGIFACTKEQCCTPRTCAKFADTLPKCTTNCAKNDLGSSTLNGANVPLSADNSEVAASNPKYYAGFDWTSCLGKKGGQTCQPTCLASATVTTSFGSAFVLACDAAGYIGYRNTDAAAAAAWNTKEKANTATNTNPVHDAAAHLSKFGYWVNFGDYPYTPAADGGIGSTSDALGCALSACQTTSGPTANNLVANSGANVDYSTCAAAGKTTGDACTPTCISSTGYAASFAAGTGSATKVIDLVCNSNTGAFNGATNLQCTANACTAAAVTNSGANLVWTSCDPLVSGQTCTPTCKVGFTANAAATGFKLDCLVTTGAFNGALETTLTSCTANECKDVLASTKRAGINYDECESSNSNYFTTGRNCPTHCDRNMGYVTNLPPDVEVTVVGGGTQYHVNDVLTIASSAFAATDHLGAPDVLIKVLTLATSAANGATPSILEGSIGTVAVITPAHFYRGVQSGGTDNVEVATVGVNAQPLSKTPTGLVTAKVVHAYPSYTGANIVAQNNDATFTLKIRRLIIVNGGTGWVVGDTFTLLDSQLGNGGAINLVFTVKTVAAGVVTTVGIDDAAQILPAPLRKPGQYASIAVSTAVTTAGAGLVVTFIVAPTTAMVCNTLAAVPLKSNTYDFSGAINAAMTCVPETCNKIPLTAVNDDLDWSTCLNRLSGTTCTPGCKGGHATTHTGAPLTLSCPNGWIDTTLWTDKTTCVAGTCSVTVMTNKAPNVDYTVCNGKNTGDTCQPTCIAGSASTGVAGSLITLNCATNGVFSGAQTTTTGCGIQYCTATSPTAAETVAGNDIGQDANTGPKTGAEYAGCVGKYTGQTCAPTCKAGFGNPTGSSWLLQCNGDGTWGAPAGSTACSANACSGSVTPASLNVGVDYAVCNSANSGGTCTYACKTGFVLSTATSSGSSFPLACNGLTFTDPGVPSPCTGSACSGGITGTVPPHADYTSCKTKTSGQLCTPTCVAGYRLAASQPGFALACDPTAFTFTNPNANFPVCQAYACSGTVTGNSKLDYSLCKSTISGFTCTPACPAGYTCTGAVTAFTLACSSTGAFTDIGNNGITVVAKRCLAVKPGTAIANVDYSHCTVTSSYSGSYCTPRCVAGYTAVTAATSFKQVCDIQNDNSGWFMGTNTIDCEVPAGQTCAGLGWSPIVNGVCGSTDSKLGPGRSTLLSLSKTYAQAFNICDDAGVRLCTQVEIDQGSAKDTAIVPQHKNQLGNLFVWTSTLCNGAGSHISSHNQANGAYACVTDNNLKAVQCCTGQYSVQPTPPPPAPTPPPTPAPPTPPPTPAPPNVTPATSTKSCIQLGWAKVINGVCGESDQGFNAGTNACYTTIVSAASNVCTNIGARLCTTSEINTGVTTGTGCNFDLQYIWTSNTCTLRARTTRRTVGYVSAKGDGSGNTECLTSVTNRPVRCCADEGAVGASVSTSTRKTCATLGWTKVVNDVCGESDNELGGCNGGKTHAQASSICTAAGARLCSVVEIDSGATAQTGCDYDTKWVWTSDSCGAGLNWVARGGGNGERKCKPATKNKNVRCCSDISMSTTKAPAALVLPPPAPARKSCGTLGWTRIIGNVCGESDGFPHFKKCFNFRTQASAAEICSNMGARLCTSPEILSTAAKATGCGFDTKYVWTSTTCAGGYIKAIGNGNNGLVSCVAPTEQAPVRCCSDVNV